MKIFKQDHSSCFILFTFIFFTLVGCRKEPNQIEEQVYHFQVMDTNNDEPILGIEVHLSQNIGGTHILEQTSGFTDMEGKVTLQTMVPQDTIDLLLAESSTLNETHVHQSVWIKKDGFLLYEFLQDTAIRTFRPKFATEELIIARMFPRVDIQVAFKDIEPFRQTIVRIPCSITFNDPEYSFDRSLEKWIFLHDPNETEELWALPSNIPMTLNYMIIEALENGEYGDTTFMDPIHFESVDGSALILELTF